MDSYGEDPFAPASLKEYRSRHNKSNANENINPAFWNSHGDIHQGLHSQEGQDITTYQYPSIPNSQPSTYINRPSSHRPVHLPHPSPYVPLNPLVPSSGSKHGEDNRSFPVPSRKRNRNDVYSEDDCEEPPRKSRRAIRHPMHPSKRLTQGDADTYDGAEGSEEGGSASPKPKERKRVRRSKGNKYKNHGNDGENEKEEEKRERKVSKYKKKIAEGKGPEKGSLGPKGVVRIRDGQMEFRDVNNPEWTLAAYHCDFRRQFLDEAAEAGDFDQAPARGEADDDETSFEPEQQSWGPSRTDDWHNIVNSRGEKVMFQVEKPKNRRPLQEPGNWVHDGYVLLDSKNHPVKDWPGLNKTLSSEVEAWRWEAIMRVYPWLTVADLMARMPHTREKNGQVLPLQTSQAFTNRALRLRIPNQMPTARPKNGSAAYKKEILKNLARRNAKTTEDLPTLKQHQIAKARKANEGKFDENSRYVVKKKEGSTEMPPPSSRKRKANHDDDTEPEELLEAPEVKKQRTNQSQTGIKTPSPNDLTLGSLSADVDADAYWEGANVYNAPPNSATVVNEQAQQLGPTTSTSESQDHCENGLVLLFSTIVDRQHALAVDRTFTSPAAVKRAREEGFQLDFINVDWYRSDVPRYVNENGSIVEGVVHIDAYDQIALPGGFNDSQGLFQGSRSYDATSSFPQDAGTFNDNSQGTFPDDGAYNATSSFAQDAGTFDDDSQGIFHGDGAYDTTPSFAHDDGAFDNDSPGILQGNGAYDATQSYAQEYGAFDATSTFPQGDLPSDFNTFYNQNGFGGNPNPLPQIPTNPLPALPTQPEGTQQSEAYETQPDIFEEVWNSLTSHYSA